MTPPDGFDLLRSIRSLDPESPDEILARRMAEEIERELNEPLTVDDYRAYCDVVEKELDVLEAALDKLSASHVRLCLRNRSLARALALSAFATAAALTACVVMWMGRQ
jgi:hypothetical protein